VELILSLWSNTFARKHTSITVAILLLLELILSQGGTVDEMANEIVVAILLLLELILSQLTEPEINVNDFDLSQSFFCWN